MASVGLEALDNLQYPDVEMSQQGTTARGVDKYEVLTLQVRSNHLTLPSPFVIRPRMTIRHSFTSDLQIQTQLQLQPQKAKSTLGNLRARNIENQNHVPSITCFVKKSLT
jgi:hypothetical protein